MIVVGVVAALGALAILPRLLGGSSAADGNVTASASAAARTMASGAKGQNSGQSGGRSRPSI